MINNKLLNLTKDASFVNFSRHKQKKGTLTLTPNLPLISRELTNNSQVRIIINSIFKLNPIEIASLIINNLPFASKLFKRDFATGIKLLCELEIIYSKKKTYLLHGQITDTAVALNNTDILTNFFLLSQRYNFNPGIITNNIGPFLIFFSRIKKLPKNLTIYTPINKNNYLMNPSYEDVYEYLKTSNINFTPITNE